MVYIGIIGYMLGLNSLKGIGYIGSIIGAITRDARSSDPRPYIIRVIQRDIRVGLKLIGAGN